MAPFAIGTRAWFAEFQKKSVCVCVCLCVCDFVVEAGQAWWECLWRPVRPGRGHPGLVALPWPVADQLGFSCVRRSRPPVPYRCDL